jgi:type I restriction enzyme R subunit
MIAKYVVQHESTKSLMVLRPYQYYAVEKILDRVAKGRKNGYIWHTTGSGKTLTSFKTAQAIIENPKVAKAIFVVDRADLDYQTTVEFNEFSPGSVDGTDNTGALVKQLNDPKAKLVVTTLQKLNAALSRQHYRDAIAPIMEERVVFVFDECHRSQFGDSHDRITEGFSRAQLFGFTGTPILKENTVDKRKRTTKTLFHDCLHRYVITDAIRDENVLRFGVEYWGKIKLKDGSDLDDQKVRGIDQKGFYEDQTRIDGVVDWVIANHDRKTHGRQFAAIMCAGSVEALTRTYDAFARKKEAGEHDLKVATIFTFAANEDDEDASGLIGEPDVTGGPVAPQSQHSRDKLSRYVDDYNAMFGANATVKDQKGFYAYYKALAKRMKDRDRKDFVPEQGIDVLLVVNMFLTGFDAKTVNTLYVDKNLRYHGLIQAFSRTNRIIGQKKSQGNIVCFRYLKEKVDEAVTLFSNKDALETVLIAPYESYIDRLNKALAALYGVAAAPGEVDHLPSENEERLFVLAFREVMRLHNVLSSFSEFTFDDLDIDAQTYEDFKSKYLDIHDKVDEGQDGDGRISILDEVDFELELIRRDNINVAYILALLASIAEVQNDPGATKEIAARKKAVLDAIGSEYRLRSKRNLIEEFIAAHLPLHRTADSAKSAFEDFWQDRRGAAFNKICADEGLCPDAFGQLVERYLFAGKLPLSKEVSQASLKPLGIMERRRATERVAGRLTSYVETFDEHMGDLEHV